MRLHDGEVPIDADLARRLLRAQVPTLAGLPIRVAEQQGTDNVVLRVGDALALRMPRHEASVASLEAELTWLPRVAPSLPLPVPEPVERGEPGEGYPFPWAVCRWLDGTPPEPADLAPAAAAEDLGRFVAALHAVDTEGGPEAVPETNRGGSLPRYDEVTRRALAETVALMRSGRLAPDLFDPDRAEEVWAAAVAAPAWDRPGVWLHRDLHGANLLAAAGRLTGVLDWGGLVVGDPAGNLLGAWHVLPASHRPVLRELVGANDATWLRARGWALSQGLQALPYYLDTHPGMVAMATRAIRESLADA